MPMTAVFQNRCVAKTQKGKQNSTDRGVEFLFFNEYDLLVFLSNLPYMKLFH